MTITGFLLCLLKLWMCLLVANGASECFIEGLIALCGARKFSEVPALPPHVTYVDLSVNIISEIHENSFNGSEAIQILYLSHQDTRLTIKNNAFSRLINLTELYLGYNQLLRLEPAAFNGLFNLRTLDLTYCNLHESILSGDTLRPLISLEKLLLKDNQISRVHPASFFINMSRFHTLDVSGNWINSICEDDLLNSFQGKHFNLLKLSNIKLRDMNAYWSGWTKCGNPFKDMSISVLDLSLNSFSVDMAVRFFRAIRGTKIHTLSLNQSAGMGKGLRFNNLKDPDNLTFKDLKESGVKVLDLSKASINVLRNSVFGFMPDLEELSLASNKITQIQTGAFLGLGHLKKLDLFHNLLDTIDSRTFKNLQSLEEIDLSSNKFRIIQPDLFKDLPNLVLLDLSGNNLQIMPVFQSLANLKVLKLDDNKIPEAIEQGEASTISLWQKKN